jgi:hypothetical protein
VSYKNLPYVQKEWDGYQLCIYHLRESFIAQNFKMWINAFQEKMKRLTKPHQF